MRGIDEISREIQNCTGCPLHATRNLVVPGEGPVPAPAAIVGEGPGAEEDATGRPFVGPAGKLMDAMLREAGIPREKLWIGNTVKCRAHTAGRDRPPTPQEASACLRWLRQQLALVRPAAILCVGRIAASSLLGTAEPVSSLRGKIHPGGEWAPWIIVTYHPSYVLRSGGVGPVREAFLQDLDLFRRSVRVELGTASWPWHQASWDALARPGQQQAPPSTQPPWTAAPTGNVPGDLPEKLLGPRVEDPSPRIYLDTSTLHPAWKTPHAIRVLLERFARQVLRARSVGPLRGHTRSGLPCHPEHGSYVSAPCVSSGT